jgi:hypothetical protein
MQLGRAEARLDDNPEAAELARDARGSAKEAIAELRDLARRLAPPVLADRGLPAAAEAIADRSAIRATVDARTDRRPPPVVETAAYFVIAESLTNAAKHAGPDAQAHVSIRDGSDRLTLEITDDGRGGAIPAGGGLTGLRHRVEALRRRAHRHQRRGARHDHPRRAPVRQLMPPLVLLLVIGVELDLEDARAGADATDHRLAACSSICARPTGDGHRERTRIGRALGLEQALQRDLATAQADRGDALQREDRVRRDDLGDHADAASRADLAATLAQDLEEHELVAE